MRVEIDYAKSVRENADIYYAISKKAKKKLGGLDRGAEQIAKKIRVEAAKKSVETIAVKKRERKWYEKFHWFFTSEGFLAISGKDAKGNETVVKKLMEKDDVYFHADIHGAPHAILRTEGKKPSRQSLEEAAVFAAVFSKAWQEHLSSVDVYSVRPEQVSKSAPAGESIGTGAFMIYGEREWFRKTALEFAIGFSSKDGIVGLLSGPIGAVKKNSTFMLNLSFGDYTKGDAAKRILGIFRSKLGKNAPITLDDVIALLPNGGISVAQ